MSQTDCNTNYVLIGGGIMSATLGLLLKTLDSKATITIYEKESSIAQESTKAWNNAGTGHAAYCELNYTKEDVDGGIDIAKALRINEQFEISKQLWSYCVKNGILKSPKNFINPCPHMSFVWGEKDVAFLKKRHEKMTQNALFEDMKYTEEEDEIKEWAPLLMGGRKSGERVAATRMENGTDVNFGALTEDFFEYIEGQDNVKIHTRHEVINITKVLENGKNKWKVAYNDLTNRRVGSVIADFVFVGAGGNALPLLQKSGIPQIRGYAGFPVSGQWLRCTNEAVIERHHVKVYGQAQVGAPPMSVPHLDARVINGKKELLFGPYAGFTTKYLKQGSVLDMFSSLRLTNVLPMMQAGVDNFDLTKYLVNEVTKSHSDKMKSLIAFYPDAVPEDWKIEKAGMRVQIIKKNAQGKGCIQFGTEVINTEDGSLAGLMGASPGASTSIPIMLELLESCFPEKMQNGWREVLTEMIPSYGKRLIDDADLARAIRKSTSETLGIYNQ